MFFVPFVKDFKDGKHSEEKEFYNSQRKEREDYNGETIGKFVWKCLQALSQLWLFIVAPLAGAALSAGVWKLLSCDCCNSKK